MREFHPVADLFPLMEGKRFEELREDIHANGLLHPIVIDTAGKIIDGRNRARACEELGIEPLYLQWDGNGSILAYVVSNNLHRRHLNERQRGLIAARLVTTNGKGRPEINDAQASFSIPDAAALFNVSKYTVQRAHAVLAEGNQETIANLERGNGSLAAAAKEVRQKRARAESKPAPATNPKRGPAAVAARLAKLRELAAEGYSSRQMAKMIGVSENWCRQTIAKEKIECRGDQAIGRTRRLNSTKMMENLVYSAEQLTADIDLIDFESIDPWRFRPWIDQLKKARRSLDAFIRQLTGKEPTNADNSQPDNQTTKNSNGRQNLSSSNRRDAGSASPTYPTRIQ